MKAFWAMAAVGVGLMGAVGSAAAQPYYGGPPREPEYGYRERGPGYGEPGPGYGDRGPRERSYGFDEREYLRCNPDVRRAVRSGQMESGLAHYRQFGQRERRRLSC